MIDTEMHIEGERVNMIYTEKHIKAAANLKQG